MCQERYNISTIKHREGTQMAKKVNEYKYHIYADWGKGPELAAWYDDKKKADKELAFLRGHGYTCELKVNKEAVK